MKGNVSSFSKAMQMRDRASQVFMATCFSPEGDREGWIRVFGLSDMSAAVLDWVSAPDDPIYSQAHIWPLCELPEAMKVSDLFETLASMSDDTAEGGFFKVNPETAFETVIHLADIWGHEDEPLFDQDGVE